MRASIENSRRLNAWSALPSRTGRLSHSPYIPTLEEDNARQGFVDHSAFVSLRTNLAEYLQDPISFLYLSGWRLGEMKTLEWRDVDLAGNVVHLRPEISKNKDGRLLPLSGELLEIMNRAHSNRRPDCPLYSIVMANRSETFVKPGRQHARRRGCIPSSFMICAARLCATWRELESAIVLR
jgi:integrase